MKPNSLSDLVLTPVYWRLVQLPAQLTGRHADIVDRETAESFERFKSITKWLEARTRSWRSGRFFLADPSFLINAAKMEAVDLREIVGVSDEPIHWFFPIIIHDELDRLKESKQQPTRWLSGYTLACSSGWSETLAHRAFFRRKTSLASTRGRSHEGRCGPRSSSTHRATSG